MKKKMANKKMQRHTKAEPKKKLSDVISTGAVGVAEEEQTCPGCGMSSREWEKTEGIQTGGKTYCCEGCAEGSGCLC